MSRITRPKRGRKSSRRIDTQGLESLVRDGRMWVKLGKVFAPDGQKCWTIKDGKLLIEVETMPDGMDLTCRLATWGSGGGFGGWSIPRPGSIVSVLVADGIPEFHPVVIGVLDNNAIPDGVGDNLTLVTDDRDMALHVPNLALGDKDATEPVPHGDELRTMLNALIDALTAFSTGLNAGTLSSQASTLAGALPGIRAMTYNSASVKVK